MATLLCAALGIAVTVGQGQEPAVPMRDTGPDATGSLPTAVYTRLAALVQHLDGDASEQELRSLCTTHGTEGALNALYLGRRLGNAEEVERVLSDFLPPETSLLRRFDATGRPDPRGLEWVHVRGIRYQRFGSLPGWLVRYVPGGMEVLAPDLSMVRCPADAVTTPKHDAFRGYCSAFFSIKLVDPKAEKAWFAWNDAVNTNALESCILADWSFRRGDIGNALKLWAHARAIIAHRFGRRPQEGETFEHFIGEELATALEQQAVLAAAADEPRAELRERWRTIVRVRADKAAVQHDPPTIPPSDLGAPTAFGGFGWHEARAMVRFYDQLLVEDEACHEPGHEELATRDSAALTRYWMHKLRDSHAGRHARGSHVPSMVFWGSEDDPARKLLALGGAAIPVLIEHYEDPTPIRGYRSFYSRSTGETSYTPWRHGDACIELLNLIAGRVFRNRAAAAAWWEAAQWTDPPTFYLEQLRSKEREAREKAALWLITLGEKKYTDAVIARILDGDEARTAMLAFLKGHVPEAALPRLASLLERGDLTTTAATTMVLEGTALAREARVALLGRVVKAPSEGSAEFSLAYLAAVQDDELRASFAGLLLILERGASRDLLLDWAHLFPCRATLDALVGLLDQDGRAVIAVKRMLIYEQGVADAEHEAWREAEVREWLSLNGTNRDWTALQGRVRDQNAWAAGVGRLYPEWFR